MILYPDTKFYIIVPSKKVTGGTELLHQLGSILRAMGLQSYMMYLEYESEENHVPSGFNKYHLPYVDVIDDKPENVCVLSETEVHLYTSINNAQVVFWWMSVDNWFGSMLKSLERCAGRLLQKPVPDYMVFNCREDRFEHWAQSRYAYDFIRTNNIPEHKLHMVSDYLNPVFLEQAESCDRQRKPWVAYNPAKLGRLTGKLLEATPEVEWHPIEGMTPVQVRELLSIAMLYVDFGHHPGKDRIPREAAISGCCVITNRNGSASNDVDVPIPEEFKFADEEENLPLIVAKIRQILSDYEKESAKFESYRSKIRQERAVFEREVRSAVTDNLQDKDSRLEKSMRKQYLALLQTDRRGLLLWHALDEQQDIDVVFAVDDAKANRCWQFAEGDDAHALSIVSYVEAGFLYREGRIDGFVLLSPTIEEQQSFMDKLCTVGIPLSSQFVIRPLFQLCR